jgi:hypothetical protein
MDSLHVKRIGIEDLVSYVYIVKVDACARVTCFCMHNLTIQGGSFHCLTLPDKREATKDGSFDCIRDKI